MLGTIASSLVFTEFKGILYPRLTSQLKSFWEQWEIRSFLLLSQALQIILVTCGNRRNFTGKTTPWVAIVVWSTYLMANWAPAVALSSMLKNNGEVCTKLVVLWIPFLLLHLGGPDNITAYSLEDNELWLRYLFTLLSQVIVSLYVYWKFRADNAISTIAILIFVAGIIKYGERVWVLKHASSKMMKQYVFKSKETEDDHHDATKSRKEERVDIDAYISRAGIIPEAKYLHKSFLMFQVLRPMFSDLTLRVYNVLLNDLKIFTTAFKSPEEAFKLVEVELGFLYDVVYTKRVLLNTPWGIVLRGISCVSSLVALIAFVLVVGHGSEEESRTDMCISYLLLSVAVGMDIDSIIIHCFSNWVIMRVTRESSWMTRTLRKIVIARLSYKLKGGLKSIAQFNLIDFCRVSNASPTGAIEKFLDTDFVLRKYYHTNWQPVDFDFKHFIHSHLTEKSQEYQKTYARNDLRKILDNRGGDALKHAGVYDMFKESIIEVEFNYSLILWHIATDICYNQDFSKYGFDILGKHCQFSKYLSDYMLYLQVVRPGMLPKGIGEARFRDSCSELTNFIQHIEKLDSCQVCDQLLSHGYIQEQSDDSIFRIPGKTTAIVQEAERLAVDLQNLVENKNSRWDVAEKWKMICEVWVDMLTYAAGQCEWREHIQELRRGRELLSHVSLLMAHMGLTDKLQIVELPQDLPMLDDQPPWKWDSLRYLKHYLA